MDEKGSETLNEIRHYYTGDSLKIASGAMFVGGSLIYALGRTENMKDIGEKIADSGFLTLESVFYATRLSFALKALTNRERPLFAKDQYEFKGPGTKTRGPTSSFVSTDTAAAFAFAASMGEVWSSDLPWLKLPLYALATGVAAHRVDFRKHWPSDVIGGAVIGILVGKTLPQLHYGKDSKAALVPYIEGDVVGLALRIPY